jgi:hypothetical protein
MKPGDLPPDPWEKEGVDLWALEQAEDLTKRDAHPDDPRWDKLDGPTIDEFDDAENEDEGPGSLPAPAIAVGMVALAIASWAIYTAMR